MRTIAYWLGGLVVLVGAFLITNWILSTHGGLDWKFADEASLAAAAKAAGFHPAKDLRGSLDTVIRIDGGKVRVNGWAADFSGEGASPITLAAFVNGENIATFRTDGPRADITALIEANPKVPSEAAKNTQFASSFLCVPGDKLFVVATTARKSYLLLRSLVCP